ncbi:hypothetical protein ACFS5M_12915 [Lacinutrix iliipiscaria]|uniref:Uncharacterized protein n=1 Tax=Lacinutrix iliipiscaria TaxID=1230532 RepID=A0ABW5WTR6_9FLAO
MKNLKLMMLLFGLCTIITTQTTFAQDDSKSAAEKTELKRQMNNEAGEVANTMLQELKVLRKKHEDATPEQRVAINEEIEAIKAAYDKEIKGVHGDNADMAEIQAEKIRNEAVANELAAEAVLNDKKYSLEDKEEFIGEAKARLAVVKKRVLEAEANGEITDVEAKQRKIKISAIEEKLAQHAVSVSNAKVKIAQRVQELNALQQ